MQNYKEFFKGKKVTVMGLGLLGGAVNDIDFLAKCGAILTVTDLKNIDELKDSVLKLKKHPDIKFVLGEHRIEDFKNIDMVLQPGNVPQNSPYLIEAQKNNIPIFVSESLFAKYAPNIKIIGITGTRGKSMTTMLIYEILKANFKNCRVFLGGNVRNVSTLALLHKVRKGDVVVLELDSWALHGMGDIKISPQIAVFTSFMPDHMNYYDGSMEKYFDDKANIFKFQTKEDVLIVSPMVKKLLPKNIKSKIIVADAKKVEDFDFIVPGEHQKMNLACAASACLEAGVKLEQIKKSVKSFKGVEGRLQFLRNYKGIKIYNDNNATTPEATIAGIKAFDGKNVVLICGGADKKLDLKDLVKNINQNCAFVSLIPGTGTNELLKNKIKIESYKAQDFKDAVFSAVKSAKHGDIILFSPAFASFGLFANEYERNDLFVKIVKGLK